MSAANKAKITMYATESCPFCLAARMLLTKKGATYTDILVTNDARKRAEMERLSGRTSVPQIFIDDTHVGGFDELYMLDKQGELDPMLAGNSQAE